MPSCFSIDVDDEDDAAAVIAIQGIITPIGARLGVCLHRHPEQARAGSGSPDTTG